MFKNLFVHVLFYAGFANLWLACFNLIPIPPLDGSVLVERVLPRRWWPAYLRIRPYTFPILMVIVLANFYLTPARSPGSPHTWRPPGPPRRVAHPGRSPTASAALA